MVIGSVAGGFLWHRWTALDHNAAERQPTEKAPPESGASLVRYTSDIVTILGTDGTLRYGNQAVERMLGYRPEERVGTNAFEYIHPDDVQRVSKALVEGLASPGVHPPVELRFRHSDGSWRHLEVIANNLLEDPNVRGIVLTSRDITERKQTERHLEESEQSHRSLFEHNPDAVYSFDLEGNFLAANTACERISGYTVEELLRISFSSLIVEEDLERTLRHFEKAVQGEPQNYENAITHKDGHRVELNVTKLPIIVGGEVVGVYGIAKDVTGRTKAEEALRRSEERYRTLVETVQEGIGFVDTEENITYCNGAYAEIFDLRPEELTGRSLFEFLDEGQRQTALRQTALRKEGVRSSYELSITSAAGRKKEVLASGAPRTDTEGNFEGAVHTIVDVTGRKKAEEALRRSAEWFRGLIQNSSDIITVTGADGTIRYQSPSMRRILGHDPEERIGKNIFASSLIHPDDRAERKVIFGRVMDGPGASVRHEMRMRHRDGSWRHIEATTTNLLDDPSVGSIVINSRDVTERKEAEEALRESEERFRSLIQNSSDMVTVVGADGTILYHSPSINRVLGHAPGSRVGKNVFESALIHPEDLPRHSDAVRKTLSEPGSSRTVEMRMLHRDGTYRHIEATMRHAVDQSSIPCTVANSRDVTERKRAEEALRESQARLAEAQRIAGVGSWEYVVGEDEAHWSDEMYRIFGRDPEGFVPTYRAFLRSVHHGDRKPFLKKVHKALREGKHYGHSAEFRVVRHDGEARAVHVRYEVLREDGAGKPTKMAGTIQDVTERRVLEERLERMAFRDPLTGLPNRALFLDRLGHALSRVGREGSKVAVLFMDLDNFKYVNDSLGHGAGDRLLVAAAGRLERCVRPGDTVARLGGDEFAVLLEETEGEGGAIRVAQRVTEALRDPFELGGRELFAGVSIGVALCEVGQERPEDLLRKADLALYEAKRGGKARHALFDPETERRSMRRLELENGLRRAVERDELAVYYQPVVSLKTGRVVGFEALVRWEHPERGLVLPDEFVPLAEETGLIVPIGRWVLQEACRRAKQWQRLRPTGPPPSVAVNLSTRQLSHPGLAADVGGTLDETGLDPGRLILEVTESVLVEHAGRHAGALRELRKMGVRLAIDDFGTGYSSLSYLKRLPAGLLKLDGSFVVGIGEGAEENEVLLEGVIGIAHALGLEVVAEGVETTEQAARLRELGCDLAQGNHFSRPLPGEAASRFLSDP